ncbi:helix-turn-helix domain-containing protein [Virgibacillus ainsalahensis]
MSSIAPRLKKLREEKGLSPEELADELSFTKSIIWSYELGKKEPVISHVKRIAAYFDVSVDYLKGSNGETPTIKLENAKDLEDVTLYLDDMELTNEEIEDGLAFIRAKRMMKNGMAM